MINPFATIQELKVGLKKKLFTPKEVLAFYLKKLKEEDQYNSIISLYNDVDPLSSNGNLAGIPCLVKDIFCAENKLTTAGSNILKNFKPTYNATVVDRIQQAGGMILGKANMDEFAMGASGEFSAFGSTSNPWDTSRVAGGSSSGIAAAVAAGLIPWGVGTETGGSVRQPAAFCGLVGMYPSYGLISRFGLIPFGSSLDQAGPITRTVYDLAIALSSLAGIDPKDSSSLPEPVFDYTKDLDGKLPKNLRIGILRESFSENIDPEIKAALEDTSKTLVDLGASIKTIDISSFKYGVAVYFILSRAEAASNLARIDGSLWGDRVDSSSLEKMYDLTRSLGFGKEVKQRLLLGNFVLSSSHRDIYEKANFVRNMIRLELDTIFNDVDLILCPTTTTLPFKLNAEVNDPLAMYLGDYFSLPNCVAGYPAITFPTGKSKSNLPLAAQFIGPKLSEELLLRAAYSFEIHSGLTKMNP